MNEHWDKAVNAADDAQEYVDPDVGRQLESVVDRMLKAALPHLAKALSEECMRQFCEDGDGIPMGHWEAWNFWLDAAAERLAKGEG